MKYAAIAILTTTVLGVGSWAEGHGIPVILNAPGGVPTSFTPNSDAPDLVYEIPTQSGPHNLFLGRFAATTTTDPVLFPGGGSSYATTSGFAGTAGPWSPFTSVTYNVISPLWFADGTGPAVPASSGTHLDLRNRFGGNSDGNHAGAVTGGVNITGTSSPQAGPGVSLLDTHEIAYRLYLDPGSTQTYGAYGIAFTVTVEFDGGPTLTTEPLVNVFQLRDPSIAGGLNFNAPENASLQSNATLALYSALVPEPSSFALGGLAIVAISFCGLRGKRQRRAVLLHTGGLERTELSLAR